MTNFYQQLILYLLIGFATSVIFIPLVFYIAKKLKAEQKILHYVKQHKKKEGTPTFGGLIFILPLIFCFFVLLGKDSTLAILTLSATVSFGLLGFLDDYIKIRFKQNQGLKAYQKLIGQIGISGILSYFVYSYIGTQVYLPFTLKLVDIGVFIIPLVFFVFIALVNSTNLIDGLDGLSANVSLFYLLGIVAFSLIFFDSFNFSISQTEEIKNLIKLSSIFIGGILAYLCVNVYPAKIFMGDTGSLALGGFIASISIFLRLTLLIPIIGLMFVLTALSDVLQVGYYKLKKKRIFKMAPLHHHFQMSGINENKIVFYYALITLLIAIVNILITSLVII